MTSILNRAWYVQRDRHHAGDSFWLVGNEKYLSSSLLLVQTSCEELCRCYLSGCCTLLFNMWGKANSQSRKPFKMLIHTQFIKDKEEGLAWGARPCPWGEELTRQALGEGTSEVTGEAGWQRAISSSEWDQGQWQWRHKWWGRLPFLLASSPATCQFLKYFRAAIDDLVCTKCDLHRWKCRSAFLFIWSFRSLKKRALSETWEMRQFFGRARSGITIFNPCVLKQHWLLRFSSFRKEEKSSVWAWEVVLPNYSP